jgi:16S rRNA (uracil1498-N3)-methyltransferase
MQSEIKDKENGQLEQVLLSDIELYYSPEKNENGLIKISGEECHHIKEVMRHNINDEIFVTDGKGKIFKTQIGQIDKKEITVKIIEEINYPNKYENIIFCIPRLKSAERFEFALEKCVELGITRFIVFESARTIAKGEKIERWQKILLAAMKQSLRAWLPQISFVKSFKELMKLNGSKIIFEQHSKIQFNDFLSTINFPLSTNKYFIFGPEGGLTEDECRTVNEECRVKLTDNRLRSETAIITAASLLNQYNS